MKDSLDIQKLKAHVSLLNSAAHAMAQAMDRNAKQGAGARFRALADANRDLLVGTPVDEPALEFFDSVRASLEAALRP